MGFLSAPIQTLLSLSNTWSRNQTFQGTQNTVPTPTESDNSTTIANTAFVQNAIDNTGNPYQASGTIDAVSRGNVQSNSVLASGTAYFTCFTPSATLTVRQAVISTGFSSAMTFAGVVRIGLYTYDDSTVTATLVASTPNDTALFSTAGTTYTKSFTANYTLVAGQRYAVGIIYWSTSGSGVGPQIACANIAGVTSDLLPSMCRQKTGLLDLPSTAVTVRGFSMFNTRLIP
jgi:hypothetical protein